MRAGIVDAGRVGVVGGSHGGFLTGHLLGQHPGSFKAGVMRNPVCNIALMVGMSDIADWCFVEVRLRLHGFGCYVFLFVCITSGTETGSGGRVRLHAAACARAHVGVQLCMIACAHDINCTSNSTAVR